MLAKVLHFLPDLPGRRLGLRGLLAILGSAFALTLLGCILVVGSLIADVNRTASIALKQTVRHIVESNLDDMGRSTFMSAHWNEGAAHLYGHLDRAWAISNIAADPTQPVHVFVLDDRGNTLFGRQWDRKDAPPLRDSAPAAVDRLIRQLPHSKAEERRFTHAVGVIALYRGRPALIAASVLVPEDPAALAAMHEYRYLVDVRQLDAPTLALWTRQFSIDGLTWSQNAPADPDKDSLQVATSGDNGLGYLSWAKPTPGTDSANRAAPLRLAVFLCFLLVASALIRVIARSHNLQVESNREAHRQTSLALEAQASAEAALAHAEASQEKARRLARQQTEEQARHREVVQSAAHAIADDIDGLSSILASQLQDAARELEQGANATLTTVQAQSERVKDIQTRSRDAAGQLHLIMATVRTIGESLTQVSDETMASRALIAESADRSCAAHDATHEMRNQVSAIGETANAISALTTRTRMLALNATIEAAKAGESGAGFAVVAGEVKALANQTDQLNRSVQQRLSSIMDGAKTTSDLSEGVRSALVKLSGASLQTLKVVNEQCAATGNVHEASTHVDGYAEVVDHSIDDLGRMFVHVSTQAHQTRSQAEIVLAASAQLQESLHNLVRKLRAA